jgi:hypothetical protein
MIENEIWDKLDADPTPLYEVEIEIERNNEMTTEFIQGCFVGSLVTGIIWAIAFFGYVMCARSSQISRDEEERNLRR